MVWTLVGIVLIVVVGVSVLAYRNRSERGIESGVRAFRRELRALAPESDQGPRAAGPAVDPPRTSGVGVLRPDPGQATEADEPGGDDEERPEPPDAPQDVDDADDGSDQRDLRDD